VDYKGFLKFKIREPKILPYWPMHRTSTIVGSWRNVYVGIDAAPGISPGCYILANGKVYIDDYAQIAPNVGILSSNHFMLDIREHILGEVRIGKYCRIGMGTIIHPGVVLGDFTTVAAGTIVTQSFPQGYCVIAGNPAALVKDYSLDERMKSKFLKYNNKYEYNGYIPKAEFDSFRTRYLNV
jgi:acetyltransferase-like isoleucine patch superfamily enzyme